MQSQEVVLSFKNEQLSRRISKDSYTITNSKTNDLALVIIERKDATLYVFNSEFEEISKFKTSNINSKYNEILGYSIIDNVYNVLYTNSSQKKFAIHQFNLDSKTSSISKIDLNLDKDELFLEAISYNNSLFILSGNNNSDLTLRQLNSNNEFDILKTFHLQEISDNTSLINSKFSFGIFMFSGSETSNITKIDPRVPNAIETTSNVNKVYQNNETIYLTFDNNEKATIFYTINLDRLDIKLTTYAYPKPKVNEEFKKFNSFVFQDNIYQIASSKDEMALEIKDFDGTVLKEYYINRNMPINFKNSPIIQEGATALPFVTTRKLEQTSKYLRKISSGNLGINVQKIKDLYFVTLGGYKEINTNSAIPMVSTPAMTNGAFISYNPTYLSYNSYSITKSTYFNTILNSEFEHIKGELESNSFDRISDYKKNKSYFSAEDIFYYNNDLYFGYFNLKQSEYKLVKF